jgi:hypothetical protein
MSQIYTQQPMMMPQQPMMMQQPMMTSSVMMPQQQTSAVPNFEYVTSTGGVIAPSGGVDYQSASGSYYFQPNTPFVFYPADQAPAEGKRDVKVAKKKPKKKKSCGCC